MKSAGLLIAAVIIAVFAVLAAATDQDSTDDRPSYTKNNQLFRPANYRDWVYLSSGLGMNYSDSPSDHQMFTNVFVPRWAYSQFLQIGKWPDKTMFVVEERGSESKGSINKSGHYQGDLMGMGVEVKDATRFPDKWAYFNFGPDTKSAEANPKEACWQCHEEHAAVEHSFVQFYPTLKPIAEKFRTYHSKD
jgi:hypothetical protein